MKKNAFIVFPLLVFLCAAGITAQSRRPAPDLNVPAKANKREPKPAASPQPSLSPTEDAAPTAEQTAVDTTPVDEKDVIRVDTQLVTIPVRVSDRGGRFAVGLKKENFKIFEDGKEQEIAYFSNVEEPFTVALVLDMSYSSTFKINDIHAAAIAFINQLHPNDKIMVISFDEEVHVLCPPTNDRQRLASAINSTQIASGTSLYEAMDLVINKQLKKISGRKAIVLFTDGVDTTSRKASDYNNLSDVYELDALIYPIEYDTFNDVQAMKNKSVMGGGGVGGQQSSLPVPHMPSTTKSPFPFPIPTSGVGTPSSQGTDAESYRKADEYLHQLADRTSGRVYEASTAANLSVAFSNIAGELRQIYSLGFYPGEEKEGKRRQLKVKVDLKGLAVQARDSYVVAKKADK